MNIKKLIGDSGKDSDASLLKRVSLLEKQQRNLQVMLQQQRLRHQVKDRDLSAGSFHTHGYGIHSKQDEDGLILHIFEQIGVTSRTFLEIGVQDGLECNAANLARNLGWTGAMLEGDPKLAEEARKNYCGFPGVKIRQAFVRKDNVSELAQLAGTQNDCDLFSLDIDGNDYWIWEALSNFDPRVVVVEYNHALGSERAITIPYDPDFCYRAKHPRGYFGASLAALQKLGKKKGYALVGSSNLGPNAFFVKADQLKGSIVEMSVKEAYRPLYIKRRGDEFPNSLKNMNFVEV